MQYYSMRAMSGIASLQKRADMWDEWQHATLDAGIAVRVLRGAVRQHRQIAHKSLIWIYSNSCAVCSHPSRISAGSRIKKPQGLLNGAENPRFCTRDISSSTNTNKMITLRYLQMRDQSRYD